MKQASFTRVFFTMLKIGLFTFGGGYAMIALLESELILKRGWMTPEEFTDMVAIAESTPGPIAINCATYLGYRLLGVLGSVCATVAVCIPSFVIIYVISLFFDAFLSLTYVAYAFRGIQMCVVYLIGSAGLRMLKHMKKTPLNIVMLCLTVGVMVTLSLFAVSFSTVFYILIGGTVGVAAYLIRSLSDRRKEGKA